MVQLRSRLLLLIGIFFMGFLVSRVSAQETNDHIFPASPRAKASIDFDSRGFLVNGQRTFLVSAGIEYARVPHELWEDRLLRLRRAGFNCVEIYTFWNFHEPERGVFDFSGDHDLDAFLKLVKKMGLYAIVRVGPYYCAEWDNGGYPLWLRFQPGVKVREPNAVFEKYTGLFFDRLIPIVAANQVNRGGAVILVQLENEHPAGWGTTMPNSYFRYLREKALSLGLEVPYFFSGLHHASDPAGDPESLDDPTRPNPWLSTEFWSVWYDGYGSTEKDAKVYERRTWKIIAHGGNGYNYYMAHGGSNFGYTNNDEDAASYDYGAAVGQGGDLRPIYYSIKRAALFARSFQGILENSIDGTDSYRGVVSDTTVRVSARKSPHGNILFLDNPSGHPVTATIRDPSAAPAVGQGSFAGDGVDTMVLGPGEILPLVQGYPLVPGIQLTRTAARILGISRQGHEITLIVYGEVGSQVRLYFSATGPVANLKGMVVKDGRVQLDAAIPGEGRPTEYGFAASGYRVRVLAMSRAWADRSWMLEEAGQSYIVCGPRYAGEMKVSGNRISLVTEDTLGAPGSFPVLVYTEATARSLQPEMDTGTSYADLSSNTIVKALQMGHWERSAGTAAAKPGYNDSHWTSGVLPLQMGADGDRTADAWYRTVVNIDTPGRYTLLVEGSDRATAFVDGQILGPVSIKEGEIPFEFSKGRHVLAIFTAHDGRDKLPAYIGPIDSADRKGLFGTALLVKGGPPIKTLGGWRVLKAATAGEQLTGPPSSDAPGWEPYVIGQDAFGHQQGFGWFQATLPDLPAGATQVELHFASVDENATVFVGTHRVFRHEGWNAPFDVLIDRADTLQKPILLTLFVENYSNEGGIDKPVRAGALLSPRVVTGWRMRGGTGEPEAWKVMGDTALPGDRGALPQSSTALPGGDSLTSGPCWWKTVFTLPAGPSTKTVWRVVTNGLGHGSVWVNGHNLGRYPEKIPINGLYIPECWMKPENNTLLIFDEDGNDARKVTIEVEAAASRSVKIFSGL